MSRTDFAALVQPWLVDVYRSPVVFSTDFPFLLKGLTFFQDPTWLSLLVLPSITPTCSFHLASVNLVMLRFLSFQLGSYNHSRLTFIKMSVSGSHVTGPCSHVLSPPTLPYLPLLIPWWQPSAPARLLPACSWFMSWHFLPPSFSQPHLPEVRPSPCRLPLPAL